jgi:tetratricopeptide (TPR) repeat protein
MTATVRQLARLTREAPSTEAWLALADALAARGLERGAARQLARALAALEPQSPASIGMADPASPEQEEPELATPEQAGPDRGDDLLRQWLERWPADWRSRLALANRQLDRGDTDGAIRALEPGVQLLPDRGEIWHRLGQILTQTGRYGDAIGCLLRTAELQSGNGTCRTELGHLFRNVGYVREAIHWHGEALALAPHSLIQRLNHLFVLPMVAESQEQLLECRQRCDQGLLELEGDLERQRTGQPAPPAGADGGGTDPGPDGDAPAPAMICHPFYLIYHNRNDRALLERYGRMISRGFNPGGPPASPPPSLAPRPAAPRPAGRIRIGFLSGFFHAHSNANAFEGLIRHIDRSQFEVVLIHLHSTPRDGVSRRLEGYCQRVVVLPPSLEGAATNLAALDLDLLFFTDIGMHPLITMLACRRSAPVQATGWGVPQTSGLPDIDYYVSGDLVEPVGAEEHYSETLVRLPGLPCCYLSEALERMERPRDYYMLPPDLPLWGCAQRLEKFHPDFDLALEAIAQAVPESLFVFVEEMVPSLTQIILDRLARTAPTARERVLMLGRMDRRDFLALAGCLDVQLDTFYFSSGVTLYESIHAGTPVVTLEGPFLRSRFVAGAYRLMGVEGAPVASTPAEYVEKAVELMRDQPKREALRAEIALKARQSLYDRLDYVRGFEDFVRRAVAAPPPKRRRSGDLDEAGAA